MEYQEILDIINELIETVPFPIQIFLSILLIIFLALPIIDKYFFNGHLPELDLSKYEKLPVIGGGIKILNDTDIMLTVTTTILAVILNPANEYDGLISLFGTVAIVLLVLTTRLSETIGYLKKELTEHKEDTVSTLTEHLNSVQIPIKFKGQTRILDLIPDESEQEFAEFLYKNLEELITTLQSKAEDYEKTTSQHID